MAITITGTGTELDPYVCYSWEDFESLAYIVDIDHTSSNSYTLITPETGLVPIPQEQVNIYIKFADYRDTDDPESLGVDVKEVDFDNHCIPHTLLFQNVCQIDFNGWTFKNICVSYWRDELVDAGGSNWSVVSAECIGNTIIIENCRHNLSPLIYPKDYVKILNGRFLINEDWNALRENDVDEPTLKITNNTYSHLVTDVSFIKDEIDNYQQNDLGGNLYGRCFPLFFLSTYKYFFRVYFDRCDFITYQSGFTEMYDIRTHRTMDDGYSFIQHSPNYRYSGNTYYFYPNAVSNSPGNALFVYCNIYFYNNHGIPKWSTDSNIYFLNSKIKLFGNATLDDMNTLKQYDSTTQEYVLMWNYDNLINLIRYWHGCLYNYCNIDIIVNLPRTIWAEKFNLFTAIYNSSLNINCPNTNNCTFTGSANGGDVYYSGVFIHAYPMSFNADDDTIQNARKIIDITGVRVDNYYELLDNPDYVLRETNIPDDKYRILEMQTGNNINNYSTYLQLKQNFRYNRYIHNGLPFVPMYDFPKVEGWDVNRTINALYNDESPVKVMFNNVDITSMWTANNVDGLHWQRGYEPILQSQLYGNWFNNTEQWDNERKTIETDYVYISDEQAIQETVVPYMLEEHTYTNPMSHITYTYYKPKKVETFNIAEYQDNDWLPLETYKHSPENLTGVEVDTDVHDLTKCMWFEINKTMLNQFNWCIVISAMTTDYNSNIDNYLFYLPLTDINGVTHIYYIKQNSYYDTTEERFVLSYSTNITEESVEYEDRPINIPRNPDLYDGCHIFAINCYGILLELFVDGQLFGSINITDYMKSEEPIQYNATIGHGTYTYNENVQDKDYNVNNGFIGTILGVHMFADYCSWADIWNIYSTYGIKFFRKGKDPIFDPILKEITVAYVPNTINILEGDTISYSDFVIYGQYTSGTEEIHSNLTYSIAEGTTASGVGSYTVTITCEDLPGWSYEFTLNVQTSYIIQITQLDENLADTNTVYTCDTMSEARTYLVNASSDNRYKLEISDRYPNTYLNEYSVVNACTTLHSVYLPNKITSISSYCFTNCTNLKEVHFGNSNITLHDNCFQNCGFETITIPSNITINGDCFKENANLTTIIFNNTVVNGFRDCTALTTILLNNNITTIRNGAFRGCTGLVNVDLSMVCDAIEPYAFINCTNLETVKFSENLKYVSAGAFNNTKLISDFDNSENTYLIIDNYLLATKTITDTSITLPNTITGIAEGVLNIGGTMPNCTTLTLPTSLKYLSSRALYPMNAYSTQLQTLNIPSLIDVQSSVWLRTNSNQPVTIENINLGKDVVAINTVTSANNNLTYNIRATNVTINSQNTTYKVQDNAIISYDGEILYRYFNNSSMDNIIPDGIKYVSNNALELLNNTTSLYIPSSVIDLGSNNSVTIECVTVDGSYAAKSSLASMFNKTGGECVYTENVSIRTIDSTTLKPINSTVTYDTGLTTTITNALNTGSNCYSIYTGIKTDLGTTTLSSRSRLYKAVINNNYTVLSQAMFQSCANLKYVKLPETLTIINDWMFYRCTSLSDVYIPNSVTSISENAFSGSGFLPTGSIPTTPVIVSGWLISWTGATGDITIDASVRGIANNVFKSANSGLTTVNINNVIYPNWEAYGSIGTFRNFNGCNNITNYYVNSNNTAFSTNVEGTLVYTKDYKILVKSAPKISGAIVIHPDCTIINPKELRGNSNITSIDLNNVNEPNWGNSSNDNFYNCSNITNYSISNDNTMYASYDGIIYTKNYDTVLLYPKGKQGTITFHDNCRTIAPNTIPGNLNITTINLNNVTNPNWGAGYSDGNFKSCTNLTTFIVNEDNTDFSGYDGMVYSKDFKTLIKCPKAKQSNVLIHPFCTTIGADAFKGVSTLNANYTIDMNNVTNFEANSVYNISAVIIINKPIKELGVQSLYNCTHLSGAIQLDSTITKIGANSMSFTAISFITFSNSLTEIGSSAFNGCKQLTSVTLPNSLTTLGDTVFSGCTALETVVFPNSIISVGYNVFGNTPYLATLRQQSSLTIINNNIIDALTCTGAVTIPEGITYLPNQCFYNCSSITSVSLPSTLTDIRKQAFYYCSGLTSINIPNTVTHIGAQAFRNCTNLQTLTNIGNPIAIEDYTFYSCTSLTNLTLPNSVTSIGQYAFYYCTALSNITISSNVISIGQYAFQNCTSLTTLTIPNSVETIGQYAFYNCSNIVTMSMSNNLTTLGQQTFNNCAKLTSINIPGTVKRLEANTFNGCKALTTITLNEGLEIIGNNAFGSNSSAKCGVTTITIPKSVTTFETTDSQGRIYTFYSYYFSNLQTIYIKNPEGTYDTAKWQSVTASIKYI